ncbi:MAG TPA: pyridoxamine 5'-phosphate oxidase family protein [Nannocystaceae bacterium]|nr:pyridoxamine 5'-phosphate oxidase family protein [Nannocystaceae bacterium]
MSERFHDGEQSVQARMGVRARMAEVGERVIRRAMPEQHRELFGKLPWLVVGATDAAGQPWASAIAGPTGFVEAPTPTRLTIDGARDPADPVVGASLHAGDAIAVLGLEAHTRRRNRANGVVAAMDREGLAIDVRESFGNCPKYIQARRAEYHASRIRPPRAHRSTALDDEARTLVRNADTFFIASAHPRVGVDVSHRGGRPGFVGIDDDVLVVPDFTGNFFFNTLGNLVVDPRAGLLFVDYDRGDLLHVATTVEIVWEGAAVDAFPGAERLLRFAVREVIRREAALPLAWSAAETSPFSAATGTWAR